MAARLSIDPSQLQLHRRSSTKESPDLAKLGVAKLGQAPMHRRPSRMENFNAFSQRRQSLFRRVSQASFRTDHSQNRLVKLENTYQISPKNDELFSTCKVQKLMYDILESHLETETYDATTSPQLAKKLGEVIKNRVKEMHFPRYKLVCHVTLGQNGDQCMQSVSRSLWNTDTDTYTCASYKTQEMFAIANLYAVYFE